MDLNKLSEMIYKRRSVRKYKKEEIGAQIIADIEAAIACLKPLYPDIRCELKLVCREDVRTLMPWMPPHAVAVFSEVKDGYLENAGFILEQLDLYIQSLGLGSCWVGLGRPKRRELIPEEMEFVMLLAFGETELPERASADDFKRRDMSEIADAPDPRLEPARLAPSSVNSQPWYFAKTEGGYDVYKRNLVRTAGLSRMNVIDVGIAMAHLYVSMPGTFSAERRGGVPERDKMTYIASVAIG